MDEETDRPSATAGGPQEPPSDALSLAWKLATGAPKLAVNLGLRGAGQIEKLALQHLKRRLEEVSPGEPADDDAMPFAAPAATARGDGPLSSAAQILQRLIDASQDQTIEDARERLAQRIVRQLVPDEVRILAALAGGLEAPLVHLGGGPLVGPATQRWIENMSPIGKESGVRLLDEVPRYITHLRDLGLLESGEEQKALQTRYQLVEADSVVRQVCAEIERAGLRPRFYRRTLRISAAGRAFWAHYAPASAQKSS